MPFCFPLNLVAATVVPSASVRGAQRSQLESDNDAERARHASMVWQRFLDCSGGTLDALTRSTHWAQKGSSGVRAMMLTAEN